MSDVVRERNEDWRSWVSTDPAVMSGAPVVTGTRVPVALVLGSLAVGLTVDQVIEHYPTVSPEAIRGCLAYAAYLAADEVRLIA